MYKVSFLLLLYYFVLTESQNFDYDAERIHRFKREFSLMKPYPTMGVGFWDIYGHSIQTNNYIRLTPAQKSKNGMVFNNLPCYLKYWEVELDFKVHGTTGDLFGDGFAFWYVKDAMHPGNVFGSKDFFNGLAIIFDTYSNHNGPHNHVHPYISAMINNGTLSYDHDVDGTHTQLAGCGAKFRNKIYPTKIRITYLNDKLKVTTNVDDSGEWKDCFSVDGVVLPTGLHFGLSAATGDLFDNHDVISLQVFDLTPLQSSDEDRSNLSPSASYFEAPRDHVDDPRPSSLSGWKKILLILLGVIAICGCVFIGGLFYSKQQEQKRKRFY